MPRAKKTETRYVILPSEWDAEEATARRNLGCPHYDECLHAANADLLEAAKVYKAKLRSGKRPKSSERYADGSHTWMCSEQCPFRSALSNYELRLRQPVSED